MSDTVHNWDIEALKQMKKEMQRLYNTLNGNKKLLVSEGFEIFRDWKGAAGKKMVFVTASNANELDSITGRLSQLIEQLDGIITKCYEPCEQEIKAQVSRLPQ